MSRLAPSPPPLHNPAAQRISAENDELNHWYCCDPNVSLCGRDISMLQDAEFEEASCVVCEAMVHTTCPICGSPPA